MSQASPAVRSSQPVIGGIWQLAQCGYIGGVDQGVDQTLQVAESPVCCRTGLHCIVSILQQVCIVKVLKLSRTGSVCVSCGPNVGEVSCVV